MDKVESNKILVNIDDQEVFGNVCISIVDHAPFDVPFLVACGTQFVKLAACVKVINYLFVDSSLTFPKVQKIEVHPNCKCTPFFGFKIDSVRFPLLHSFRHGLFKPHSEYNFSDSAAEYYMLQRNREALERTIYAYWFLKPILAKDVTRIICHQILYCVRDTPCKEEVFIMKTWKSILETKLPDMKAQLTELELQKEKYETEEKEIQKKIQALQCDFSAMKTRIKDYEKMTDFAVEVFKNKKQKI